MVNKELIVIVDDDPLLCEGFRLAFEDKYSIKIANNAQSAFQCLDHQVSVVILDIRMQYKDGFELCNDIKAQYPSIPVIFFSAYPKDKELIDVINDHKPFAFIVKTSDMKELDAAISQACQYRHLIGVEQVTSTLTQAIEQRYPFLQVTLDPDSGKNNLLDQLLSQYENRLKQLLYADAGPQWFSEDLDHYRPLFEVAQKSIQAQLNVLVLGEVGVGKRAFVRKVLEQLSIHAVTIDCQDYFSLKDCIFEFDLEEAHPPHLKYKKLFMANNGVLCLNNIEYLGLEQQSLIGDILKNRRIQVNGESLPLSFVVVATDSGQWKSRFKQNGSSLYDQLKSVSLELPSLKDVPELIPEFARHFAAQIPNAIEIPDLIGEYFQMIDWKENLKELREVVRRFVNHEAGVIDIRKVDFTMKKRLIEYALDISDYNIQKTAQYLGIKRPNLYKLIETFSITYQKREYKPKP